MKMIDLFSGIGGFHLAAECVWGEELEVLAHCESDKGCQNRLKKHWPDVPIIPDIHDFKGDRFETVDLLTGGDPCQPYSVAGKQGGVDDDRYLWPEVRRVIEEARPTWYLGENVVGLTRMGIEQRIADLESQGYEVQTFIIPACAVDAKHRRDRVWILAHSGEFRRRGRHYEDAQGQGRSLQTERSSPAKEQGLLADSESGDVGAGLCEDESGGIRRRRSGDSCCQGGNVSDTDGQHEDGRGLGTGAFCGERSEQAGLSNREQNAPDTESDGLQGKRPCGVEESEVYVRPVISVRDSCNRRKWAVEPDVGRVVNGLPGRVDRLKGLGNAIVPQIAEVILSYIKQIEESAE